MSDSTTRATAARPNIHDDGAIAVLTEAQRRAQREFDLSSPQWRLRGTFDAMARAFGTAGYVFRFNEERGYATGGDCAKAILQLAEAYLGEAIDRD